MLSWFKARGLKPFKFQKDTWDAYRSGMSGLIHASTGTGKTYAIWPAALMESLDQYTPEQLAGFGRGGRDKRPMLPLTVIWLTPLRALANDLALSLNAPVEDLDLPFVIETRTGDTAASTRTRQKERLPYGLITTPESLSILLSYPGNEEKFSQVKLVVVDEWHELLGSKRGVQAELALARLRRLSPTMKTWGLSATIGNLDMALAALVGDNPEALERATIISGSESKLVVAESVLPERLENLPWTGHTGLPMIDEVIDQVAASGTSIVFTNTRSQTEQWYLQMLERHEDFCGQAALHHGSLDIGVRRWVEEALKNEKLKFVVSTSSLDLGVDFSPVDQVLQVGSPKGVARAMQRAGRSGHSPGKVSKLFLVPCHALELVELCAARLAMDMGLVESRSPHNKPIDVLCQHVTTIALGSGFREEELFAEVRETSAYKNLTRDEWRWVLNFVGTGGAALAAYPEYHRIKDEDGRFVISDKALALRHRLSIGTIVSDQSVDVCFTSGERIGQVEESFIARLKKGDRFVFAGRFLEFIDVRDMKARVRLSPVKSGLVPRWMGGRLPLSSELASVVRKLISDAAFGVYDEPEMAFVKPLLNLQAERSALPELGELLIEYLHSREGRHLFVYPFEGRLVNEGLANLVAFKLSQVSPSTFSIAVNDWGFEILSGQPIDLDGQAIASVFQALDGDNIAEDIRQCLNAGEMARRKFREIARVAGLIFQGYPGGSKTVKQVQVSSGLLFDVFADFDPGNLLVRQAHDEVLENNLEISRLKGALSRINTAKIVEVQAKRATPFSLPLMVDRLRGKLSSEKLAQRVLKMKMDLARDMHI
ncbi:MAG: ligase-associated DNA damage response DEXH box helicase [Cyanobacteria bacterium SZAS TMP-1]|nr:ligase-associated DNA damage response DEXH box helicase [Cyanobacteria bacterium SZAS TMP-1]